MPFNVRFIKPLRLPLITDALSVTWFPTDRFERCATSTSTTFPLSRRYFCLVRLSALKHILRLRYSGKDREPAYAPSSTPLDHNLAVPEGKKLYQGSCHCQAVRFAVVHDPLEKSEANDCNCSLCGGVSSPPFRAVLSLMWFAERNPLDLPRPIRVLHARLEPGKSGTLPVRDQGQQSLSLQDVRCECV